MRVESITSWLRGSVRLSIGALMLAVPAGAQVTTFGADLTLPANVTFDCSVWPVPLLGGGVWLVPTGAASCTWTTFSVGASLTQGLFVPAGNGTVTQIRLKVGATTGPMQIVVLQGLREEFTNNAGCCQQVGQSDVFTPQANAITTVPVALPVRNDTMPDQNHIFAFDILGLSILEPGVAIPAFDTGNYSPTGASDAADFPASQPNASIQPNDPFGYSLLMNADWVPSTTTAPGGGGGGPPTTSGPPLQFATPEALVQANNAIIALTCTLAGPCPGRLRLQNGPAPGATIVPAAVGSGTTSIRPAARTARLVTYAGARFKLAGGQTATIRARLKRPGRKLTRTQSSANVWANVTFTGSKPAQVISAELPLHR
jgi:hypothetical protein